MSTLCDAGRATLIVIDVQERLMPAIYEGGAVVRNALMLAQAARMLQVPVIGTAQNPAGLGPKVPEVHALCECVIAKMDFDACAQAAFLDALNNTRDDLIVIGCEAHVCVLQTVLGLLQRKRRVRVVADAVGSRQPFNKAAGLERAKAAGAELVTTEMVLFESL
ncbi:MAG: isochorismatase family protein, partial [Noviherbaspirillum sp.]